MIKKLIIIFIMLLGQFAHAKSCNYLIKKVVHSSEFPFNKHFFDAVKKIEFEDNKALKNQLEEFLEIKKDIKKMLSSEINKQTDILKKMINPSSHKEIQIQFEQLMKSRVSMAYEKYSKELSDLTISEQHDFMIKNDHTFLFYKYAYLHLLHSKDEFLSNQHNNRTVREMFKVLILSITITTPLLANLLSNYSSIRGAAISATVGLALYTFSIFEGIRLIKSKDLISNAPFINAYRHMRSKATNWRFTSKEKTIGEIFYKYTGNEINLPGIDY